MNQGILNVLVAMLLLASVVPRFASAFVARTGARPVAAASSRIFSSSTAVDVETVIPRVKTSAATAPTEGPVLVKGWVRTVRKQKTLAFVEVNDGSNLGGIQCVLSFDAIDDDTQKGM